MKVNGTKGEVYIHLFTYTDRAHHMLVGNSQRQRIWKKGLESAQGQGMDICVTETTAKGPGASSKDDDSADEALVFQIMTMWSHLGFLFILIILLVTLSKTFT